MSYICDMDRDVYAFCSSHQYGYPDGPMYSISYPPDFKQDFPRLPRKLKKQLKKERVLIKYDGYLCDLYLSPNFDERVKQYYEEVYRSSNNTSD